MAEVTPEGEGPLQEDRRGEAETVQSAAGTVVGGKHSVYANELGVGHISAMYKKEKSYLTDFYFASTEPVLTREKYLQRV